MIDGKHSKGRPVEMMMEGMTRWFHGADVTEMLRSKREKEVRRDIMDSAVRHGTT